VLRFLAECSDEHFLDFIEGIFDFTRLVEKKTPEEFVAYRMPCSARRSRSSTATTA
jgi:hypothetical protein